ncbi:hypothetical protein QZH41_019586 [Actinostola sp. cb2023]|nr:hypothetical protein QZH41_019586 [Actinostola sp. cb2023]
MTVYSPGEQVHGKVNLTVKQQAKVHKLNLEAQGQAYVSWPENFGTYTSYRYYRHEYFKVNACVYDQETLSDDSTASSPLQPNNTNTFSFRFTIPYQDLPPSYESMHGYIRYSMKAEIQNRNGKTKMKTDDAFFMVGDYEEYDEEELEKFRENEQVKQTGGTLSKRYIIDIFVRMGKLQFRAVPY